MPKTLVTVLHATEIYLGWSISDAKIKDDKLKKLLKKEDFDNWPE